MKLVHVTSGLGRTSAGVREVVWNLAQAQKAAGVDVTVLGLQGADWKSEAHEWDEVAHQAFPVQGPRKLGYSRDMQVALKQLKPDVVHQHGLWMHPGRSVLQWHRATGRPYVVSPHGMLSEVALSHGRVKKRLVAAWFQDAVLRNAALLHVTSRAEKAAVDRYIASCETCIIPNGVPELDAPKRTTRPRRTILSLGRIHRIKALDQLVLAWQSLESSFPDWSLLIAGPDEQGEAQKLSRLIKDAGLKRANVQGPAYGSDKVALMASAGIFALPSRSENFAVTVAESLMLGVPVVSSHGAPWADLESKGCGLWVPFGAHAMADALRRLMSLSDAERMAMGARGRAWMQRDFSWASVSGKLQDCYNETISRTL